MVRDYDDFDLEIGREGETYVSRVRVEGMGDARHDYANCRSPARSDGYEDLAPVGSFRKSPWGLYDMYGNVSEWVADWFGAYPANAATDPVGPATGMKKVRRGGSFDYKVYCDSIYRASSKPGTRSEGYGFRVVGYLAASAFPTQGVGPALNKISLSGSFLVAGCGSGPFETCGPPPRLKYFCDHRHVLQRPYLSEQPED